MKKNLLFAINVDWYYKLHWEERIISSMTKDFRVYICYSKTQAEELNELSHTFLLNIQRSSINPLSNLTSFYHARKILLCHSFDLIHTVTIKPNLYFGILARLYNIPILITVPGLGSTFSSVSIKFTIVKKIITLLYKFTGKNKNSFFVFENSQDRQFFLNQNICSSANSATVSGAGIDLNTFTYKKEIHPGTHPIKILFAARLLKGKGLDDLIEAISIINTRQKRVELLVAGITDTDSTEAIPSSQIKQWEVSGKISFLGQVQEMPKLLTECHIVALPTKYGEGLPRILIEANACGRPVITTDIAGCNEFIKDGINGFLIAAGCIDELVNAIEKLLDPKIRNLMGQAGRERVEQGYSKEHVIKQYQTIYKKLHSL